nr:hypothetical protein [Tanacetum cinerariifolium]
MHTSSGEKHEEVAVHYVNLKASIDDYYNENIFYKDQTDQLVEASMSFLKKSSSTIDDLYKGLESTVKNIQDHAFKKEEASTAWMKSSTNMAWNLGSRILGLDRAQTYIKSSMSSLQEDTSSIKSMMTEMYNAFRGQSSLAPSNSGETDANIQDKPKEPNQSTDANIEFIGSSTHLPSITQAQSITIIHPEPSIQQREGKCIATDDHWLKPQYWDKEEEIKKAEEEARLNAISKIEVIKVICEEVKKLGIHLKEEITTKAGELFKKDQEAEHEVLKRQHTKKVRKSLELIKH